MRGNLRKKITKTSCVRCLMEKKKKIRERKREREREGRMRL